MPTYEYECGSCNVEVEIFQSITEKPKRKCPECGRKTLKRLISSGGGIIFKGSGFYETDYRSADYKKAAEADKKSSSESKGDSKGSDSAKKSEKGSGKSESGKTSKKSSTSTKD